MADIPFTVGAVFNPFSPCRTLEVGKTFNEGLALLGGGKGAATSGYGARLDRKRAAFVVCKLNDVAEERGQHIGKLEMYVTWASSAPIFTLTQNILEELGAAKRLR